MVRGQCFYQKFSIYFFFFFFFCLVFFSLIICCCFQHYYQNCFTMCVAFLYYGQSPLLLVLLAFNRDEYLERPSAAVHLWDDQSGIVGGKDLRAGGTWLGVSQRNGHLSLLTNYRENVNQSEQKSRGELTVNFLKNDQEPQQYYNVNNTM
eukprot:TRINITY_DN10485_c1_g1_i4.p1 TRINITY_DN10485_c1_g1~~TRINITY_DN10485_c1_g1_i4.p1  ORF type:complete len:150 (-),score=8.03 TRINITY_DN10485_c1_g1_i4:90-539(-)